MFCGVEENILSTFGNAVLYDCYPSVTSLSCDFDTVKNYLEMEGKVVNSKIGNHIYTKYDGELEAICLQVLIMGGAS
jgi:hypothetical protein